MTAIRPPMPYFGGKILRCNRALARQDALDLDGATA